MRFVRLERGEIIAIVSQCKRFDDVSVELFVHKTRLGKKLTKSGNDRMVGCSLNALGKKCRSGGMKHGVVSASHRAVVETA